MIEIEYLDEQKVGVIDFNVACSSRAEAFKLLKLLKLNFGSRFTPTWIGNEQNFSDYLEMLEKTT